MKRLDEGSCVIYVNESPFEIGSWRRDLFVNGQFERYVILFQSILELYIFRKCIYDSYIEVICLYLTKPLMIEYRHQKKNQSMHWIPVN